MLKAQWKYLKVIYFALLIWLRKNMLQVEWWVCSAAELYLSSNLCDSLSDGIYVPLATISYFYFWWWWWLWSCLFLEDSWKNSESKKLELSVHMVIECANSNICKHWGKKLCRIFIFHLVHLKALLTASLGKTLSWKKYVFVVDAVLSASFRLLNYVSSICFPVTKVLK